MDEPTVLARGVRVIGVAVGLFGCDPQVFFSELGVDVAALADIDARVPHSVATAAWNLAARLTRNPSFALRLAETLPVGAFDVLEYCMRVSQTMRGALDVLVRYQRVIHDAANITVHEAGDDVRIHRRLLGALEPAPRGFTEFLFSSLVVIGRSTTGVDWSPREVHFSHARPDSIADHERVFRSPLTFAAPIDALILHRSALDLPMRAADPVLGAVLERQARALLERLPDGKRFADLVRHNVYLGMRGRTPTVQELARKLGVSERSFHRRLADEGVNYREIVDRARCELALAHVSQRRMPLAEIAFVVGFSEVSAFHRAFRRWTGKTPLEWRRAPSSNR